MSEERVLIKNSGNRVTLDIKVDKYIAVHASMMYHRKIDLFETQWELFEICCMV